MASVHLADLNDAPAPSFPASIFHEMALLVKKTNGVQLLRRGNRERWLDEHSSSRTEQIQALVSRWVDGGGV